MRNPKRCPGNTDISPPEYIPCEQLANISLENDRIVLLLTDLEHPQWIEQLDSIPLRADEHERMTAFQFEIDRQHFSMRRRLLKYVLSVFTNKDAAALSFRFNAFGKPSLAGTASAPLAFNTSYSAGSSLIGLRAGMSLGVDMERIRPLDRKDSIIRAHGTRREIECFESLPPQEREYRFFHWWVRKEAIIKAVGRGVSCPLNMVETNIDGCSEVSTVTIDKDPSDPYQVTSMQMERDLVLALAYSGSCSAIRLLVLELPGN